jgi:hypothetical protein
MRRDVEETPNRPVRVPADVDRPDTLLAGLTGRQLAILATTGLALLIGWALLHSLLPAPVLLVGAVLVGAAAGVVTLGRRDGLGLDRWLAAAGRHHRAPHRLVTANGTPAPAPAWITATGPEAGGRMLPAPLRLPARGVAADGTLDLGPDGVSVLVAASTVNFALRTAAEQQLLVDALAGVLQALDTPVQILVRSHRVDLAALADRVEQTAPGLAHPALEAAALGHAATLRRTSTERDVLRRSVLLVLHAPAAAPTAALAAVPVAARADTAAVRARRAADWLAQALTGLQVRATVLDGPQVLAALAACADPYRPDTTSPPSIAAEPRRPASGAAEALDHGPAQGLGPIGVPSDGTVDDAFDGSVDGGFSDAVVRGSLP